MSDYKITNLYTGQEESLPVRDPSSPTGAWVMGWEDYMHPRTGTSVKDNPYDSGTDDWHDYEDGWEEAERD